MSEPRLDWTTAKVRHGKLTVDLEGDLPSGWKRTFGAVAAQLNRGEWNRVGAKKHGVRVAGVTPGSEEKLRHFLECVIQQANVDHDALDHASQDSDDSDGTQADGKVSPDAQMTAYFREFADVPHDTA
jgi:hypothetical protein